MTGKSYYLTTVGAWQRHATRFAGSHFVALGAPKMGSSGSASADTPILVLVEADEGVHLALENDTSFTALPHPLAEKPIPENALAALAGHGVNSGATTFDVATALSRVHPLLRHRVF
jgi:hypothetical protein